MKRNLCSSRGCLIWNLLEVRFSITNETQMRPCSQIKGSFTNNGSDFNASESYIKEMIYKRKSDPS